MMENEFAKLQILLNMTICYYEMGQKKTKKNTLLCSSYSQ